jgi:hypothetical protein
MFIKVIIILYLRLLTTFGVWFRNLIKKNRFQDMVFINPINKISNWAKVTVNRWKKIMENAAKFKVLISSNKFWSKPLVKQAILIKYNWFQCLKKSYKIYNKQICKRNIKMFTNTTLFSLSLTKSTQI